MKIGETVISVVIFVLVVGIALLGWQYASFWKDAQEKIEQAQNERNELILNRAALESEVASLTNQQETLNREIEDRESRIAAFDEQIEQLNSELEIANFNALVQVSEQSIAEDFMAAYDLTSNNVKIVGVREVTPSGREVLNQFLQMPIDISKDMTVAKQTQVACAQEVELQENIRGLQGEIIDLTNETLRLEQEKTRAYNEGYEEAYGMYMEINDRYLDTLRNPPAPQLLPNWLQIAGGLVGGLAICGI